jgi:hypothetical protein
VHVVRQHILHHDCINQWRYDIVVLYRDGIRTIYLQGMGTHDRDLIRICVTRSEKDMVQIKQEFQRMYKKSLDQAITVCCCF